jgi:hypothetical protein
MSKIVKTKLSKYTNELLLLLLIKPLEWYGFFNAQCIISFTKSICFYLTSLVSELFYSLVWTAKVNPVFFNIDMSYWDNMFSLLKH